MKSPTTAQAVLDRLIVIVPEFGAVWECDDNLFREEGGAFTCCGVFAEFSHFFRDNYERLSVEQRAAIGRFVGECVASLNDAASDAVASCFLENIAGERFVSDFRRHLSGDANRFFQPWDRID